jgi:16S rRNA (cytosine1402-N4)-methyltransferase
VNSSVHVSVLLEEVVNNLGASNGGHFLDCTLGGGGHTRALLKASPETRVVAIDRDKRAIDRMRDEVGRFDGRLELYHARFSELIQLLEGRKFSGVLADLGMSTDQLREGRGFSFSDNEPLDMRMDEGQELQASHLVNELEERELFRVLKEGGVGQDAKNITRTIMRHRPVHSAKELDGLVKASCRTISGGNPSAVVFQALRMAVNRELEEVRELLSALPRLVEKGGRTAIICFHSLEDKEVGRVFREWQSGDTSPAWWPGGASRAPSLGKLLTKKAIQPSEAEVERNPASRSARLRVFEFCNI